MPSADDDFIPDDDFVPDPAPAAAPESHFFPRSFSEAAQQAKDVGLGIYHGARRANDFATNLLVHPVDTAKQIASNPGASYRQTMRGVNSNIPFANQAVEAIGGPPAASPEDAAAAPRGLGEFAGFAAAPGVGKAMGGIASKGIEAGGNAIAKSDQAIGARAVKEAAKPAGTSTVAKAAQKAGAGAGAVIGYKTGGAAGAAVGGYVGKQAGETVGKLGDRLVSALARRYTAKIPVPSAPDISIDPIQVPDNPQLVPLAETPPSTRLAPLVSTAKLPDRAPIELQRLAPHLDEITGEPVTQAGQGGFLPTDALTKAGSKGGISPLEKEGQDVLEELAKLRAKGVTSPPPELAARAQKIMAQIDGKPTRSFADDVKNTAKLVKMATSGGAKRAAIKKAGAEMGLPDEIVSRVLEKAPLGHEAAPGE